MVNRLNVDVHAHQAYNYDHEIVLIMVQTR